jgi:UDP-N-acetylmuramoyl-tripeptide--D-alanyl-D-alanine ligase
MIPLTVDEVRSLCPGDLQVARNTSSVTGVQIDSRRIGPGELFVAIGSGAQFRDEAFGRGAAAVLVPDDAFAALAALGKAVRDRSSARVVGITGSTGKTSTKDILAALCRLQASTVATERSFNAEIGLPLTLTRIEPGTRIVIAELGMRGVGQIAELCAMARPEVGVITRIGPVHLELLGTVERVAQAKAEVVAALPSGGTAVAPSDAPELEPFLRRDDVELVRFGPGGEVALEHFEPPLLVADVAGERVELEVQFTARHQAQNTLAALAAYRALGLPLDRAAEGAREIAFSAWRGEELELAGGVLLINDSYNANPVSMRAALEHLAERAGARRKLAVLGDMAELGPDAPDYHREVGRAAVAAGVDALVAIGTLACGYLDERIPIARWAPSLEEGIAGVQDLLEPGDVVLVKGSRALGLEAVAEALTKVAA